MTAPAPTLPPLLTLVARWSVVVLLALLGAGCARSATASNANYVDFPERSDGLDLTSAAQENSGAEVQPTADFVEIESLIGDYLAIRASVVTGRGDADSFVATAHGRAVASAIADYDANETARVNGYNSAVEQLWLWPNIVDISMSGEDIVVVGCDERQEINALGQHNLWFVQNHYTLTRVGESLLVADVAELHNGFLEPGARYGCAPQSFQERAESASAEMWTELVTIARDPQSLNDGLSEIFGRDLATYIEATAAAADGSSAPLATDEEIHFATIGIDTQADLLPLGRTEPGTTVVVESCRRFDRGLAFTDPGTGERFEQMAPGSELVQYVYVRIDTSQGEQATDKVVAIETLPDVSCTTEAG